MKKVPARLVADLHTSRFCPRAKSGATVPLYMRDRTAREADVASVIASLYSRVRRGRIEIPFSAIERAAVTRSRESSR